MCSAVEKENECISILEVLGSMKTEIDRLTKEQGKRESSNRILKKSVRETYRISLINYSGNNECVFELRDHFQDSLEKVLSQFPDIDPNYDEQVNHIVYIFQCQFDNTVLRLQNDSHITISRQYENEDYKEEVILEPSGNNKTKNIRQCSEKINSMRRSFIHEDAKNILEQVFKVKKTLTTPERIAIAKKCGITPVQVRVWFTNKRMRTKC